MEITIYYILSQILAFSALALTALAYQQKNKSKILSFTITGDLLYAVHYFLLGAWSGVATKIISVTRDAYIRHKGEKQKSIVPLIAFIFAYLTLSILTFDSPLSLLPLSAAIIYSIGIYNGTEQHLRLITILVCTLWLFYNFSVSSVAGMTSDLFVITSNIIAYFRYKKSAQKTGH